MAEQTLFDYAPIVKTEAEEWRAVVGWEGLYDVSSFGRVRSACNRKRSYRGKILRQACDRGYMRVAPCRNSKNENRWVHILVAAAFIGPRPEGHEVNHKDSNRSNNHVWNLEYVTHQQNQRHGADFGRIGKSTKGLKPKYTAAMIECIRSLHGRMCNRDVLRYFNISRTHLHRMWHGEVRSLEQWEAA